MVDIVDLRIQAENLASERLVQVAEDVRGLGRTAENAQQQVEQLEVTQRTLRSFEEAGQRVNELQNETAAAATQYQRLREQLRETGNATAAQTNEVNRQQQVVRRLQGDLRGAEREYRNIEASLRQAGVNTGEFAVEQERLNTQLVDSRREAQRLADIYDQQTNRLRERLAAEERSVQSAQEQEQAQRELREEIERSATANQQRLAQQELEADQARETAIALRSYEQAIERLNNARNQGEITTGNYIRAEANLRRQLNLTSQQVTTSRRAIEADTVARQTAIDQSNQLNRVTRSLAAAYGLLVSAQQAAQATIGNVQAYGEFETAVINIERTTGLASEQVVQLADRIRDLGENIAPTGTNELLRFAEVAGQLGVDSTADILNLVNAADQLGVATNIAGDEAALLLTRILQTSGEGIGSIQNLSSSVVELGNNFAANEQEIVNFTREIVTAGTEINLSSSAAAALGTTLIEAGRRAESSRTAIQRLAQAIRRASVEGGESLENLANVTELTGEQIQQSLGEGNADVIEAFVRGLARIQQQGGLTADTLGLFGIAGEEAVSVFNSLAANSDRLSEAIDASTDAFARGNAQVIEASRAYASQESAVGRLSNVFNNLRVDIGEAFSDETDQLIRNIEQVLNNVGDSVIDLFEALPQLVREFGELTEVGQNLIGTFGTDFDTAFTGVVESFTIFANSLTSGLNTLILGFQNFALAATEAGANIASVFGVEANTELLDGLRESIENTRESILRDSQDITNAVDRLAGTSSRRYEDLINVVDRYGDSVSSLSDTQQQQLAEILEQNRSFEEQENLYQELTAAIVRTNRQREIEAELTENNRRIQEEANAAREASVQAILDENQAVTQSVQSAAELSQSQQDLILRLDQIRNLREQGNISAEQERTLAQTLTSVYEQQGTILTGLSTTQTAATLESQNLSEAVQVLINDYQSGVVTTEEYQARLAQLQTTLGQTNAAFFTNASAVGIATREQLALRVEINESVQTIQELERAITQQGVSQQQLADSTTALAQEQQRLNDLRQEEVRLNEIANSSFSQLSVFRDQAVRELEVLNNQFRAGTIAAGEYQERQRELTQTITELNAILGSNTQAIEENRQAVEQNISSQRDLNQQQGTAVAGVSLLAQEYAALNRQFDFTGQSSETLRERVRELQGFINTNNRVTSRWWQELAEVSNQGFRREQGLIRETLRVRQWTESVESGNLSLQQLDQISRSATLAIRNLGEDQLQPLRQAIDRARDEFRALNEEINAEIDNIQDRLDRARGDEAAIARRQFAREQQELQDLIAQAQQAGDSLAVRNLQAAQRQLQQAQQLEFRDIQTTQQARIGAGGATTPVTQTTQTVAPVTSQAIDVNINLNDGTGRRTISVANQQSADALLALLDAFREATGG